jgi:hypothetical protein
MRYSQIPLSLPLFVCAFLLQGDGKREKERMIHEALVHLGDSEVDWKGVPKAPEGQRLDIEFTDKKAQAKKETICITVHQYHVDDPWSIQLNGKIVGRLERGRFEGDRYYELPAKHLKDGTNVLSFVPGKKTDDIVIGRVRLYHGTLREKLRLCKIEIDVHGPDGRGLPSRITVLDTKGERVPLYYGAMLSQAVRPGICYASRGKAVFEVPQGNYRVFATHGPEWGLSEGGLALQWGEASQLTLKLAPEVDTTGYISCDTHIHTVTYSGHGDASIEERMATLSGEALELAIATDHNHQIDYRPVQQRMELKEDFKSVVGNEVSTSMGHFNAWPLQAITSRATEKQKNAKRPEWRIQNWVKLIEGIRAKGAKAVVLNHPRWPSHTDGPHGRFRLNQISGDRLTGPSALTFDAMELVNSTDLQDDPLFLVRDWFALLNHGERIMAVGSSDSHTVSDPVGQGRTYLMSSTDTPSAIRVTEVTKNLVEGRSSVSLGIFSECWVNDKARMGDVLATRGKKVSVRLRVAAPSWIEPQRALLFLNGRQVAEKPIPHEKGKACNALLDFELTPLANDAHLVTLCIGTPPGPYWPTMKPYSFAATNPVWLDADGDGRYTDPRRLAAKIRELPPARQKTALGKCGDTIAVQFLSLGWAAHRRTSMSRKVIHETLTELAEHLEIGQRALVRDYLTTLAPLPSKKSK